MDAAGKITVAGVLDIVSGASAAIGGVVVAALGLIATGALTTLPEEDTPGLIAAIPAVVLVPIGAFLLLLAVVAIAGGVAALRRGSWWLAVAGSAAAVLCFLPLGVVALVLLVLAGDSEFTRR